MRFTRTALGTLIGFLVIAAPLVFAQKVKTDYDRDYQLAALSRFAFAPLSPQDPLNSRPDLAQKIKSDLQAELQKAGFVEDDLHPDFLVEYSASKHVYSDSYSTTASAWTSGSQVWNTTYKVGTLILDFLNPKTKQPFWRGTATETVYAGSLQKYVPKGIRKLVQAFQRDVKKRKG